MAPKSTSVTLLESGRYSDLTILCGGHEFKVHRNMVCVPSPVLAAQMDGPWKEASTRVIHIEEFDAGTVERMLSYLYTKRYSLLSSEKDATLPDAYAGVNKVLIHITKVIAIANYYQVDELENFAVSQLREWFRPIRFKQIGFGAVVRQVYSLPYDYDHQIKQDLCKVACDNWTILSDDKVFGKATCDIGEFATGMRNRLSQAYQEGLTIEERKHEIELSTDRAQWTKDVADRDAKIRSRDGKIAAQKNTIREMESRLDHLHKRLGALTKEYKATSDKLLEQKAPRTNPPQGVSDMDSELMLKKQLRLMKLFAGCCGDDKDFALAQKDTRGDWTITCRLCSKKYSVNGPGVRDMTVQSADTVDGDKAETWAGFAD